MNISLIILFFYLVLCSYTDIKKRCIFIKPTITITIAIIILQLANNIIVDNNLISFITSFIPGIILLLLSFFTRESIGYGDSILLTLCSICVGIWNGLFIIMCSFIFSALFSLFLLIKGKARNETIPFIPFIFLSVVTYLFIF